MKKLLVYIALTGIIFQTGSKLAIVAGFLMHRSYISQVLCEKKNIPDNCCMGSCQLKKELAEDESEHSPASSNKEVHELVLFYENIVTWAPLAEFNVQPEFYFQSFFEDPLFSIFHPPKA